MAQPSTSSIRTRIEVLFHAWGRYAFRHAWRIIVLMLVVSGALISRLPTLTTDNSTDSFLHPEDPTRLVYDEFRRQFGHDALIMIAVEAPDLFSPAFLDRLRAFHEDLEREVPHVDELKSLVNARDTRGVGDELIVEDLLENRPETPDQIAALRERALSNPLYRNTFISRDARVTMLSVKLYAFASDEEGLDALGGFEDATAGGGEPDYLPEEESNAAVRAVREVIGRYDAPDFRIYMAGGPAMTERINSAMQEDILKFTSLSMLAIGVCLFLLFRRLAAVVLPLLVVALSMLTTLGVMAWVGGTLTIATQILPSFLLAVGVCDGVHILAIYYQRLRVSDDEEEEAVAFTLGHSGLAILMTSLTTAGGMGSFMAAGLKPVADLGIYAPIGVLFALVYTVVLMPALLAVIPVRGDRSAEGDAGRDSVTRTLQRLGDFSARHAWSIVTVTGAVLIVSGMGASMLRFSHDPINWFPEDDELRRGTLFMNEKLDGVNVVEVLVHTGQENGVHEPALLDRLEETRRYASKIHRGEWHIGKTISIVDVLKEIHQALNENRAEYYRIPRNRELVAQELLLFENSGSDDLEDFVDPLFSTARVSLRVPWADAVHYPVLLGDLRAGLNEVLGGDVGIEMTGLVAMLAGTFRALLESMARSYAIALLVIVPLMILLIGNLGRGLLSMVPNLTPVIMTLGYMGWSGLPVDGTTMMVGAIIIGLAVDDTIHFMHNFRRYYERCGDAKLAIHQTLETTGRALLVTSIVLAAGFFTFLGAYLENMVYFGALAGGAILVAFFANVILASALMVLATRGESRAAV